MNKYKVLFESKGQYVVYVMILCCTILLTDYEQVALKQRKIFSSE